MDKDQVADPVVEALRKKQKKFMSLFLGSVLAFLIIVLGGPLEKICGYSLLIVFPGFTLIEWIVGIFGPKKTK